MASNRTPTRFFGPAVLSSTPGTLYTVASNKIAVIRNITVKATDSDQMNLGIDGVTTADCFHIEVFAEADSVDRWKYVVLTEAETLQGTSAADGLVVTIDGDLYDE